MGSPTPVQAQGLASLAATQSTENPPADESAVTDILRLAAEQGVSVILVDNTGAILNADATSNPVAAGDMKADASVLMKVQTRVAAFRDTLRKRLDALPASINEVVFILRASSPDGRIITFVSVILWTLALFALGMLVERRIYGRRIASRFVIPRVKENPQGYTEKLSFLVFRFFMGVLGVLVSMAVAAVIGIALFGYEEDTAIEFTVVVVYTAYFAARIVALLWRMILSPYLSQYRIPKFSDSDAKRLYRWLWALAVIDVSSMMFTTWLAELGLNYDVYALMYSLLTLVTMATNIALVLINRKAITRAILNGRPLEQAGLFQWLGARFWALLAILYVVFAWARLTFDLVLERPTPFPLLAGAYAIFISSIVVYGLINYGIERQFQRSRAAAALAKTESEDSDQAKDSAQSEATRAAKRGAIMTFEDLAKRIAGILALVAGAFAFVRIWNADVVLSEDAPIDRAFDVVIICFIGYIVFHTFRIWIDSKIAEEHGDAAEAELGDEGGHAGATRLATLLPLFRNFILLIILVTILLIALLELGINVSPLFAGAGVVGLAIGFGAQSLVRDVFSGAFFLFDDAFRKGEYIDVGSVKGTVEKISVRSFQLRHHLGPLHTIPFGEIQYLTNYSRDWVIMKLPLRLTYDTNVEKVRKLIKKLGQELLSDPVIGDNFIQPLKSQGVVEMQDSAMIVRVKFMTKPGDQWLVRKKVFQEIRNLFEKEGVKFAHREVTVRLAEDDERDLSEREKKAVTAAAEATIQEEGLLGDNGSDDR